MYKHDTDNISANTYKDKSKRSMGLSYGDQAEQFIRRFWYLGTYIHHNQIYLKKLQQTQQ